VVQVTVNISLLEDTIKEIKKIQDIASEQNQLTLNISCLQAITSLESLIRDLHCFRR